MGWFIFSAYIFIIYLHYSGNFLFDDGDLLLNRGRHRDVKLFAGVSSGDGFLAFKAGDRVLDNGYLLFQAILEISAETGTPEGAATVGASRV